MAKQKVSWKSLEHHEGAAVEVPKWVEHLVAGGDCWKYSMVLEGAFVQAGELCTAAAPTVDLLIDQLRQAQKPEWVLRVIGNIAGNDQLWAWLREPAAIVGDVARVLFERREALFAALKHEAAAVRSAAAFVLGVVPTALVTEAIKHLDERLVTDPSEHVLASCLLAFARLSPAAVSEKATSFSAHQSALLRSAAVLARLRVDPTLDLKPLLPGLADWLAGDVIPKAQPTEFWWWSRRLRYFFVDGTLCARLQDEVTLVEMARQAERVEAWTDAMLELPQHTQAGWAYRGATDFLAIANGFANNDQHKVLKPNELPESQQGLARRLADSPLFATAGYGLPACGAVRRRWLGLEPAHLMERFVESDGRQEPLYWLWTRRKHGDPPIPQLENLVGLDSWLFLISTATGEYAQDWYSPVGKIVEERVADAAADPAIKKIGPPLLNELAGRLAECRRQQVEVKYAGGSAVLLLLPVLRAGIAWDAGWLPLFAVDGGPAALVQELLMALTVDDREAWLWNNPQSLKTELNYVEHLPSVRLVKRSLTKLARLRQEGKKPQEPSLALERKIHELAATVPHFAEALKDARAEGYEG